MALTLLIRMRRVVVILALIVVLLLSGCGITNPRDVDPKNENFYQGSEGIYMRFVPGSPPPRFFYYAGAGSTGDNSFDLSVELHNMGASAAYGALYISGYSPDIVYIEGTEIDEGVLGDCIFDFDFLNPQQTDGQAPPDFFSIFVSCPEIEGGFNSHGDYSLRSRDIAEKIGLDSIGISEIAIRGSGTDRLSVDMGWDFENSEYFNHGHGLALLLSGLDLGYYQGYPFNSDARGNGGDGLLMGDNYLYPGGEHTFQTFTAHIGEAWPQGLDQTDVTFLVTGCYSYATFAAPSICVDPAPFDETEKACTPQEYTWSG